VETEARLKEAQAHEYLSQGEFERAFSLFKEAAHIYKAKGRHKQAALCFSSAASCWSKKCGESAFYNSALLYEEAAKQSEISFDPEYAALLYKYAAINYERDGEFVNFSDCFYRSKECYRKYLTYLFIAPGRIHHIVRAEPEKGVRAKAKHIFSWLALTFSYLVWGHGERPARILFFAIAIIFLSAVFYIRGGLLKGGEFFHPQFFEALYFSAITFTTVGYGDITPLGLSMGIGVIEAFCGIFVMPLFIVALSRKYLRI
jgi:tetratricopeptide (TPR) repeat protein